MINIIKEYKSWIIISVITVSFLFSLFYNGNRISSKIAELKGQNDILKKNNELLFNKIQSIQDSIESTNENIQELNKIENQLSQQYEQIKNNINSLKSDYEKANDFAANYDADSIRWYFSNIK